MSLRALGIAGTALIAAALLAPSVEGAPRHENRARPEQTRDRDAYGRADRESPARGRPDYRQLRSERCESDGAGSILGAIAGGLLGRSAADRHPDRPAGTLVSAERDCD
jgi:hypothetical protein